jgi:hypothetical protein
MVKAYDELELRHRRRFHRRPVRLPVSVVLDGRELRATTLNISPGGAFLAVELPAGTREIVAKLGLPNGREMHVRSRVCWHRPSPEPGVGIAFEQFLNGTGPRSAT